MKQIFVVIPNKIIFDTLYKSTAFDRFLNDPKIRIRFITPDKEINAPFFEHFLINKKKFSHRIDLFFWYLDIAYRLRTQYKKKLSSNFKFHQLSFFKRLFFYLCSFSLFYKILFFIEKKFFRYDNSIIKYFEAVKPDLLIAPASATDSYSYFFLAAGKLLNIPTLLIVSHWDYFSKKGLRIFPDKLYVWGLNMYKDASKERNINSESISILGAPHFDKYYFVPNNPQKLITKKNKNQILLFFAGTSIPYDEKYQLQLLDDLINKKNLNIHIDYKPHPRAWLRKSKQNKEFLNISYIYDEAPAKKINNIDIYDGIITPFSSMMIEFGILKKPSFLLNYNDNLNSWDFSEILNENHIIPITNFEWIIFCSDEKTLSIKFDEFITLVHKSIEGKVDYTSVQDIVFNDRNQFKDRFYLQIKKDFGLL